MKPGMRPIKYFYRFILLGITLTGFAQMPIFKRYYIADIPGLGWLAQFYVTHYLHYLFAIGLTGLAAHVLVLRLAGRNTGDWVTVSGCVRGALVLGLVITGIFLVIRNLPGRPFAPEIIIALDLAHLGLCMVLLGVSFYALVTKKVWTTDPPSIRLSLSKE